MKSTDLPSWEDCCRAVDDESATPLQQFIHDNGPTTDEADEWRNKLAEVLSLEHARIRQKLLDGLDTWTREKPHPVRTMRDRIVSELMPIINNALS